MDKNTFYKYDENRALTGYGSAWLVALPENGGKFSIIGFTESVPYVFSDKESFDFNVLQQETMGQIQGKTTLEAVDVAVMHHRDNAYRFSKLAGQVLQFMSVNGEFVGYKFSGTLDNRPDTAEADIHRATVTITPASATSVPVLNARPEIMDTLAFNNPIKATVAIDENVDFSVKQSSAVVAIEVKTIGDNNVETTASVSTDYVTDSTKTTTLQFKKSGLYAITVKAAGFASWTTTVYVDSAT
jgi:hypothetical protein